MDPLAVRPRPPGPPTPRGDYVRMIVRFVIVLAVIGAVAWTVWWLL